MNTFFLLRHSFAEPFGSSDRERVLSEAGVLAAQECGKKLRQCGFRPNLVLCSNARRARQTAEIVAAALNIQRESIVTEAHLYDCFGEEIPAILEPYFEHYATLLAVGHNPAVSEWAACCGAPAVLLPCEGRFFQRDNDAWNESILWETTKGEE